MDPSSLNLESQLGQGSSTPLIDMSTLMPLIVTSTIVGLILTVLVVVYFVYTLIRHYKVEKATLTMQKDIRAVRELLEQQSKPPTPHKPDTPTDTEPRDATTGYQN